MPDCTLQRTAQSADGPTFGHVTRDDTGVMVVSATLELPDRQNQHNISRIPSGSYLALRFNSPHIGYELFQLANVPDRVGIDMHVGNTMVDTDGCILLGTSQGTLNGQPAILESKPAFDAFMAVQQGVDRFTLTITDPS